MTVLSRRPQTFIARAATVFGLYAAAALLAGLLSLARLEGDLPLIASAILTAVAFATGRYLLREGDSTSPVKASNSWSQFGGIVAGIVLVTSTLFGVHASVLACRGETVSATVDGVDVAGRGRSRAYLYRLVDADGHRIPGYLTEGLEQFAVGSRLTVVVDPDGLVQPETLSEVEDAKPIWIVNGIGLVATGFMALFSARSRPREGVHRRGSGGR
ncbi:hypothetical protein [Dactylosporangium matsuzakiense]|uniref:DUF3592 domain-containing protein n=1 Tax=Dactylosporangium matsuzakiense TaxID=53360 RepID=A0A9W6NPK9_9ACTN|nr:hypothetical protein [Dactylosporangium matsuzakiense]GLL04589.1 hypothetical protein GCM10017581_063360 [Dactylosporangium matsuzakiense]